VISKGVNAPSTGFENPPARLVEAGQQRLGRFHSAPSQNNLLDANYLHLPRPLRWLRLKEWHAFQIATPRLFANVALFDAKLMGLMQAKVYDRARSVKYLYERKLRPGAFRLADQLLDSETRYHDGKGALGFRNQMRQGRIELDIDLPAGPSSPTMKGRLTVQTDRGASQVVSLPFGGDVGMYSHKGMFPVEGELTIGADAHRLTTADAVVLMDDHKGYYPYVMRWDWVTSASRDAAGVAMGFNLTRNQCREPHRYNENCVWVGERVGRLPAVTFEREHERAAGELWRIRDREGRVDVTFEPSVPGDVKVNAGLVESRYRGPFGLFRGRLAAEGLEPVSVDGWFGMGEDFWLRC
jgi:Protein of unknown function (DUF2804)